LRELLGEQAPLSASTIIRLKDTWAADYGAWRERPITDRSAYIWADGVDLGAGLKSGALVPARRDRRPGGRDQELLALELGDRESTESWATVLRRLRERGLAGPLVAVGDGGLGLWAARTSVFPSTRPQRCWNQRAMNLAAKLPKRLQPEFRARFQALYLAPTRARLRGRPRRARVLAPRPGPRPHRRE
jgi:putative transposase